MLSAKLWPVCPDVNMLGKAPGPNPDFIMETQLADSSAGRLQYGFTWQERADYL